jgi:hypothetical protein
MKNSSSKVTWTEKYCYHFSLFYLQILNFVDFFLAAFFISFSLYLFSSLGSHSGDIHVAWLEVICFVLGILLFLTSAFSFLAISITSCRLLAYPTNFFAFLVVCFDLAVGIAGMELQSTLISYLEDNGEELGLSSSNITTIKNWYVVIIIGCFISLALTTSFMVESGVCIHF